MPSRDGAAQYPASLRNLTTGSDTVDDGGRGIGHKAGAIVFSVGRAKSLSSDKIDWF
jgi:hypothetical protein